MGRDYFKEFKPNDYNDVRDKDLKLSYIESLDYKSEDAIITVVYRLAKLGKYEDEIGKSILDWTSKEIEDYLKLADAKNKLTLMNLYSATKDYAAYCAIQRNKETNSNVLPNFFADEALFTSDNISRYVNARKLNECILGLSEYEEIISNRKIPLITRVAVILLWYGVPIDEIDELFLLKKDVIDLENRKIQTNNKVNGDYEWLYLGSKEVSIIQDFYKEETTPDYEYDGVMWPTVSTGTGQQDVELFYLCEPNSERIFHRVVGYFRIKSIMKNENMIELSFRAKMGRRLFKELAVEIDKKSLRPKDIIKSGALFRLLYKFNIDETELRYNVIKKPWRDYVQQYCTITFDEIIVANKKDMNI